MARLANFPKVKIDLTNPGRGSCFIDGVEMKSVQSIHFKATAQKLTRVTLSLIADVELTAEEAEVVFLNAPKVQVSA